MLLSVLRFGFPVRFSFFVFFLPAFQYIAERYRDIYNHLSEIDEAINEVAKGWKTTRMGKVDLALIRLAVYEIRYDDEIPFKVAVNEAVELAKQYGTNDSPSFVNGILAKFAE